MYTIEHRQEAYHRVLERLQSALQKEPDADESICRRSRSTINYRKRAA